MSAMSELIQISSEDSHYEDKSTEAYKNETEK